MAKIENKTKRRENRETAFILVFENTVTNESIDSIIENAVEARDIDISDEYIFFLANGTVGNVVEIDTELKRHIKGWTISRLSKVSLSILRLAIFELLYEKELPVSIAINEAVELAKKYGDKSDAPFVNGVLSSVAAGLDRDNK